MADSRRPSGAEVGEGFSEEFLTKEFFSEHWEKKPKLLKGNPRANQLPKALDTDQIFNLVRRSGNSLKMFNKNESYDDDSFMHAYLDGCSMIINQADRVNTTLFDMSKVLAERHFHHVFGVLYLTPGNSQAVRLHTDDQDVFLLQVWGKKHWTMRNNPIHLPYTEEMLGKSDPVPPELVKDPIMTFDMEPGDALYIPRGFLHEAETSSEPSLHITITVPTSDYCWGVQVSKQLTQSLFERKDLHTASMVQLLRQQARPGPKPGAALTDESLQALLQDWLSGLTAGSVVDGYQQRMAGVNTGQERGHQRASSERLRPAVMEASRVRLMHGVAVEYCGEERAIFNREGRRLDVSIKRGSARLLRALQSTPVAVVDLPLPDNGDRIERLCTLNLLHRMGALQLFVPPEEDKSKSVEIPL